MLIPYQYNRMAAGAMVIDSNRAIYGTRGVFTFLRNGSCNQSAMTMSNRYLVSSAVSRMEVSSAGLALNATVNYGASIFVRNGGAVSGAVVNSNGNIQVSSGGVARAVEVNNNGYVYVSPGASASEAQLYSNGQMYVYSNASVAGVHVSNYGGLYGQGTSVVFESCVLSSNARFDMGNSSGVQVRHMTIGSNASMWCYNSCTVSHTTVMSAGILYVSSGAKCYDVTVSSGGRVSHGVWGHDELTEVTGTNHLGSFYTVNGTACNYVLMGGQDQQLYYYASAISCHVERRFAVRELRSSRPVQHDFPGRLPARPLQRIVTRHRDFERRTAIRGIFRHGGPDDGRLRRIHVCLELRTRVRC